MTVTLGMLLKEAADARATDLYLIAGAVPCMNCDGVFQAPECVGPDRTTPQQLEAWAQEMMSPKQWEEFVVTREMNLAYMSPETGRFRVNALWQRGSIGMVFRRVVMDIPTLRELGLPPILRNIALADRGIVVVTGSTGSGKSTTMASMIDYRAHLRSGHIVTIEDPIEFVYQHRRSIVTQREVGMDTMSFEEALKNTLRQAPQVISIGEMRDASTVQFALHAAETGHLVFATLHSTNAPLTLERILHFFHGEQREQVLLQMSLNLKAIICQRLIPKVTGGRACACEILLNTPRIQDLVAKGDLSAIKLAIAAENSNGIQNFDRHIFKLAKTGKITPEDALTAADSANDLQMKFRGLGLDPNSSWMDLSDPWENVPSDYQFPEDMIAAKYRDPAATGGYSNETAPPLTQRNLDVDLSSRPAGVPRLAPANMGPAGFVPPGRPPGVGPGGFPFGQGPQGKPVAPPRPVGPAGPGGVLDRYRDMIETGMPGGAPKQPGGIPAPPARPPAAPPAAGGAKDIDDELDA